MTLKKTSVLEPFAAGALAAIEREYPNLVTHLLRDDADARPPRALHPAFFGSFDWHSAVHGHWCLARYLRLAGDSDPSDVARRTRIALARSLTPGHLETEHAYASTSGREGFERPYGLAWVLQLALELREWAAEPGTPAPVRGWARALEPLEELAAQRLAVWLPKLPWPIRSGEHAQSAFALGLALDWARGTGARDVEALVVARAADFYGADVDAPIAYEPSGQDFLSPILAEADLMRRVWNGPQFAAWLERFLPDLESDVARRWLTPVSSPDRADGKLAHLDGLNLSRAWMLEGIVAALDLQSGSGSGTGTASRETIAALSETLAAAAVAHRKAGLERAHSEHYAGSHWLGSFAVYLLTWRGWR